MCQPLERGGEGEVPVPDVTAPTQQEGDETPIPTPTHKHQPPDGASLTQIDQENNAKVKETDKKRSLLSRLSHGVNTGLEMFFESHGRRVATYPTLTIALCLIITSLCAVGCVNFSSELRPFKLWIPQSSDYIKVLEWQVNNFPDSYRRHTAIWESDNVLTARAVREMWRLHERVHTSMTKQTNVSWHQVCARVPTLTPSLEEKEETIADIEYDYGVLSRRRRKAVTKDDDLSLSLPRNEYCNVVAGLPELCYETSLLEVWGYDEDLIMTLTDNQVIEDINAATTSQVFGFNTNFENYLGNKTYDNTGRIISAGAALHVWLTILDRDSIDNGLYQVDLGNGQMVDIAGISWEKTWVDIVLHDDARPSDIHVYAQSASSFGQISDSTIWSDVVYLAGGFAIMFCFVNSTLGRRNLVEQRPFLSLMGILSVGQAIAVSNGLCSAFGITYGPVNSIIPVLLVGLGVDDMFVIIAAWEAEGVAKNATSSSLIERAAHTMRKAGVAITITSLTDVIAFAVGATTDLPALRSFCVYAAVGILAVYVFQASWFLAWLVHDERRMSEHKDGLFWCKTYHNWKPSSCSQTDILNNIFKNYYNQFLLTTPTRIAVLVCSASLIAASTWAASQLHIEFNPMWFLPKSSYLYDWFKANSRYFPSSGEQGYIYFSNVTLPDGLPALRNFSKTLQTTPVISSMSSWYEELENYMSLNPDYINVTLTLEVIQDALSLFLQSPSGALFRNDLVLDGDLHCKSPAPLVKTFRISIVHHPTPSPTQQSAAMAAVKNLVELVPVGNFKAAWSQAYIIWETNEVISHELWRNLILAAIVVGSVILVLLASMLAAVLVLVCVTGTVLGVGGAMWVWGLTVDTVSCMAIVLAIGFSVDYASHIAHAFLTTRRLEDKVQRAKRALDEVGPAIFQGGISTILAFILLAGSSSHVFITFFKVFVSSSVLGLFYGLVFLPVVLSFIGPDPYFPYCMEVISVTSQPTLDETNQVNNYTHTNVAYIPDDPKSIQIVI